MANEKILNTRVQLKYDSYENWQNSTIELKAGEIAIAYLGPTQTTTTPDNGSHPVLFKVGPGVFKDLPWASALAADVHAWAKKSEDEFKAWVKTLCDVDVIDEGTGKFVTDISAELVEGVHTITVSRADVVWGDIGEKPTFVHAIATPDMTLSMSPAEGHGDDVELWVNISKNEGNQLVIDDQGLYVAPAEAVVLPGAKTDINNNEVAPIEEIVEVVESSTLSYDATNNQYVLENKMVSIPTLFRVERMINETLTGSVDYLGLVHSQEDLSALTPYHGDFVRVATTFNVISGEGEEAVIEATYHAGDLLIYHAVSDDQAYPPVEGHWEVIHGEEGDIIAVAGGEGLAGGGDSGAVTITHAVPAGATEGEHKGDTARTYITNVITDKFGHVVGFATGTEDDQDLSDYKVLQTPVASPETNGTALEFIDTITQNENGEITATKKSVNLSEYAKKDELPVVNDGKLSVAAVDATVLSVITDKQFSANAADDTSITLDIAEKGIQNKHIADKTISAEKTKAYVANAGDASEEVWVFYCGTSTDLV